MGMKQSISPLMVAGAGWAHVRVPPTNQLERRERCPFVCAKAVALMSPAQSQSVFVFCVVHPVMPSWDISSLAQLGDAGNREAWPRPG